VPERVDVEATSLRLGDEQIPIRDDDDEAGVEDVEHPDLRT
jgi:hypothetical protein